MPFARGNTQTFIRKCRLHQKRTRAAPSRARAPTRIEAEILKTAGAITIGTGTEAEEEIETGAAKEDGIRAREVAVEGRIAKEAEEIATTVVAEDSAKVVATDRAHKIVRERSPQPRSQRWHRRLSVF